MIILQSVLPNSLDINFTRHTPIRTASNSSRDIDMFFFGAIFDLENIKFSSYVVFRYGCCVGILRWVAEVNKFVVFVSSVSWYRGSR